MNVRASREAFERLELRAHSLLADVPLHDVWTVELPGGGTDRTISDVRSLMSLQELAATNVFVRLLFAGRAALGRLFGWDAAPPRASRESYLNRLSTADRELSRVEPGASDGPFHALYASRLEWISEVHNKTVHAFSVLALVERANAYRLYWAIYVRPIGPFTAVYMRLIDPFRRWIVYPAVLRQVRAAWARECSRIAAAGSGPPHGPGGA